MTSAPPPAAEQAQEQQHDVEDVEEDAGRDRHGLRHVRAPQAPEVEDREAAEDDEAEDRVDDVRARNRHEQRDEAEHDQGEQRPEQGAAPAGEVALGRVAERAQAADEQPGGTARLPQHGRVVVRVEGEDRAGEEAEQEPEAEEQRDRERLAPLRGGDVQAKDAADRRDEGNPSGAARQVAADVRPGGGEYDRDRDEAHDLAEDRAGIDALAAGGELAGSG